MDPLGGEVAEIDGAVVWLPHQRQELMVRDAPRLHAWTISGFVLRIPAT